MMEKRTQMELNGEAISEITENKKGGSNNKKKKGPNGGKPRHDLNTFLRFKMCQTI